MTESKTYIDLMEGLKKEAACYRRLCELGDEQKEILVAGELPRLPENVRLSEKEVFALGPLASSRTATIGAIGREWGLATPSLTVIAERVPSDVRADFQKAVSDVVESARRLDDVNRANEKLLENAVGYVNFTLKALSDGGRPKDVYTPESLRLMNVGTQAASTLNRVV
jgi:hypothetical protein